jgi:NitT/TauT family transport system substrate-binding protein
MNIKLAALCLGATIFLSACSASEDCCRKKAAGEAAPALTPVTIAQFGHVFLYMPLYVAMDKGIFKKHGLDVKLISTGGDEKTFTAVATGNAQFGVSDPTFTAIAREHGQGGKVVAAVVRGVPFWVVTMDPKIDTISKPNQFNGYRCAAFTAPSTSYAVMKKILSDGHAAKAKIVQGAFGTLPALLKSKQADVAIEIEPTVSIVVGEGGKVVYSPKETLGDFAFTGLEVSDTYAKEHPEQIKACVASLKEAMDYIHTDFDGAVAVAQKEFPEVKPAVVKDALARLRDSKTIPADPHLPKQAWDAAIALRHELGDLKGAGTYEENVDMSYVETK